MFDVICISDGLIGQPHDEMRVVEHDHAKGGLINFIFDDAKLDDVGCIFVFDVQFDMVSA